MAEAQISTRELPDEELEQRLVAAVRARGGKVTEADVVVDSGVPPHQVGPGLRKLLEQYKSHLSVTDDGELIYEFDRKLERRDKVPWAGLKKVGRALWRGFKAIYKVSIAVVLVGYVAVFAALLIAAMLAKSSNNDRDGDDGPGFRGGGMFGWGDFFFWGFGWGSPSPRYRMRLRAQNEATPLPFYKKVYQFVFGPEETKDDELGDEKALLAWIRDQRGVISPTELSARTGWSLDAAEQESTRLLARYGGDVEVTDDGRILYTFKDLMTTADSRSSATSRAARPVWESWEASRPVTGNSAGANLGIGALNAFVALSSFVLLPGYIAPKLGIDLSQVGVWIALLGFPAVYSALFFLVPLARRFLSVEPENRRRALRNLRRAILRDAFAGRSPEPAAIAQEIPRGLPAADASPALIEEQIKHVGIEFEADAEPDASGRIAWRWDRIAGEREAAEARRRGEEGKRVPVGAKALAFTSR